MRLKLSVLLCVTLMYCVWTNGRVSHMEFLVERWHRCGRVTERLVNGPPDFSHLMQRHACSIKCFLEIVP